MGVLGVFVLCFRSGGVSGRDEDANVTSSKALILAAVGILSGKRFKGGSRSGWTFLFCGLVCVRCLGSPSGWKVREDFLDDELVGLAASIAFIASAKVVKFGLAETGVSILCSPDSPEDRAEKKGCSISLWGDSKALGMAGTGGTSSPPEIFKGSKSGLGVGSLDVEPPLGNGGTEPLLSTEL